MPSNVVALIPRAGERDLIDRWIRSENQTEIGLLDLVVLDQWIAQLSPESEPGRPDGDREPENGRTLSRQFFG